jgi:hypothetical protein
VNHSGTLSPGRIRSALYVDFDNIFLNLQAIDRRAAEVFATDPLQWLTWIERGMPTDPGQEAPLEPRGTLLRRCYLNPDTFQKYRAYFTLAAFSVIDCPSLTTRGKNSADILMVMDIMDALAHPVRIDEFIILSSDADFTPVMLRLRAHDRRTTMLNIGMVAQAYKAASGTVIEYGDFIEHGLRVVSRLEPKAERDRQPEYQVQDGLLQRLGRRLIEEVKAEGEVGGSRIPEIFKEVHGFRNSNWGGFYKLRLLAEEIVRRNAGIRLTEDDLSWKVILSRSTAPLTPLASVEGPEEASRWGGLRQQILHLVRERVAQSAVPLSMATVAHEVIRLCGPPVLESGWAGAGTFKDLLTGAEDPGFGVYQPPGMHAVLYDPARHGDLSNDLMIERLSHLPDSLRDFARRISQVTGAPLLTPEEFRVLFQALEEELKVNKFSLFQTSKAVRDRCIEQGFEIARKSVNFLLQGIAHTGHRFDDNPLTDHAENFAEMTRENLVSLCGHAQLPLTEEDLDQLVQWIPGGRLTIEKQDLDEEDPLEVPAPAFSPKVDDGLEVSFLDE